MEESTEGNIAMISYMLSFSTFSKLYSQGKVFFREVKKNRFYFKTVTLLTKAAYLTFKRTVQD